MESYNADIWEGVHIVKATLQLWEFAGHIVCRIGGNCLGRDIIESVDFTDCPIISDSDCRLVYEEENDSFFAILTDRAGNKLVLSNESAEEMNKLIVAVEILSYEPIEK